MLKYIDILISPAIPTGTSVFWVIVGLLGLLIILLARYLAAKRTIQHLNRENEEALEQLKKANEELQSKSGQLSGMSLHLTTLNNVLEDFTLKTSDRSSLLDTDQLKKEVRQLHKDLKHAEQSMDSVKLFVDNAQPNFFEELEKQYPQVSNQDVKLLTLLKMKLSNKEISNVMNVTLGAVFQSKRRLKKKLGLKPEDTLSRFLQTLEEFDRVNLQMGLVR